MMEGVKGYLEHQTVGSTYILGSGKDKDVLILVDNAVASRQWFIEQGWECESDTRPEYDDAKFYSLRQGDNNALITADKHYYARFLAAAEVCKYLAGLKYPGIKDRVVRVMIHKIVRDGEKAA